MIKQKIKVMHIAQSAGGVAEYLANLLKYMNKDLYENILVVSNDYNNEEELLRECDKHYFVEMIRKINFKSDIKAIKKIRKIVKNEKPDIIYLHSSKAGALGRLALFLNHKIKIIYNAHGWYFNADIGKKKKIYQLIEKILAIKADKIIAISNSEYKSALEKKICKRNKLVLIENGIDIKEFEDCSNYREIMREKFSIPRGDVLVGIVGRISEQKDPMTSIKAASKIIKENKHIHFMFVGTGDLEQEIIKYSKKNGIDENIIITGWVKDVKKYISAFDIALLPSKWEGFGLAIVEYMVCKKPIITTRVGGIADILNSSDKAFYVEKGDYDNITQKINYILHNNEKVKKIVNNNYEECKIRFAIEREIERTENLFKELVNEKGADNEYTKK